MSYCLAVLQFDCRLFLPVDSNICYEHLICNDYSVHNFFSYLGRIHKSAYVTVLPDEIPEFCPHATGINCNIARLYKDKRQK